MPSSEQTIRDFAQRWCRTIAGTSYVSLNRAQVEDLLIDCTKKLVQAMQDDSLDPTEIGDQMVANHFTNTQTLGRTIMFCCANAPTDLAPLTNLTFEGFAKELRRVLSDLAAGFARALRDRTLDEQEEILRAGLAAQRYAEHALRKSQEKLRYQALHDPLTTLPNRTYFFEQVDRLIISAQHQMVGMCYVDIDHFKAINDTLGHDIGDHVLVEIGRRLSNIASGSGKFAARLGSDEFALVIEEPANYGELVAVARETVDILKQPIVIGQLELPISASVGVLEYELAAGNSQELMKNADLTLQRAKSVGRGRWAFYDPRYNAQQISKYQLSAAIPAALERGEFFLQYQPLVSLTDGAWRGVEALVRWRHPERGVLGPGEFIPLAEETGLIIGLGRWVLEQACLQGRRWRDEYGDAAPFVSVNIAVRQLRNQYAEPNIVAEVARILATTGLPAHQLQLELTEDAVVHPADDSLTTLEELADMGVRIAIDDFGTGYSNLSYLRRLPVHSLKLDGSFVAGLRSPDKPDPIAGRIIATLVSLAQTLNLNVTAEGIETKEQAALLRAFGCDTGQGYLFSRPMLPEELSSFVSPYPA